MNTKTNEKERVRLLHVRIPEETYTRLYRLAQKDVTTMSQITRDLLAQLVELYEESGTKAKGGK